MPSRFAAGEACAQMSREIEEPRGGTAPRVNVWFLLEYGLPWATKIRAENELPAAVKTWLTENFDTLPGSRLQFITQDRRRKAPYHLFVVVAHPSQPRMYAFTLRSYDEITALDLPAIIADAPEMRSHLTKEPLFLVCTNSQRDPCCAKYGFPIYKQLAALAPGRAWQCSHVGGDRFAANVLCFPHGLYYGRVDAAGAEQIVREYHEELVTWEYLRGRSSHDPVVQAAERLVRESLNTRAMDALELASCEAEDKGLVRVVFRAFPGGDMHSVTVEQHQIPCPVYKNCRAAEKSYTTCFRPSDPTGE